MMNSIYHISEYNPLPLDETTLYRTNRTVLHFIPYFPQGVKDNWDMTKQAELVGLRSIMYGSPSFTL